MIVVFGSINLDLIFPLAALPEAGQTLLCPAARIEPGGKGANQALAAARDGARVVFAGATGNDALGGPAIAGLVAAGIDVGRVARLPAPTGCAAITRDAAGRNHIIVAPGANLLARASQVEDALLDAATTLLLQMETDPDETAALIRHARAQGARIILNLAPAAALPPAALRAVDVLLVNQDEAAWLGHHLGTADDAAALGRALGVVVVRTLGAAGAEVGGAEVGGAADGCFRLPAHPVDAVDTTAAGDCFAGVLAAGLDRGLAWAAALRRAGVAAALCCTRAGSQGSIPAQHETDAAGKGH